MKIITSILLCFITLIAEELVSVDKVTFVNPSVANTETAPPPNKKNFIDKNESEKLSVKKEIPINNSLLPDLPSQEKVSSIIKKDNNKDYELVLKLLQTKQGVASENKNFNIVESKEENEISYLPSPIKAIKMNEIIVVFAKYKELSSNSNKVIEETQIQQKDTKNLSNLGSNINSGNPLSKETTTLTKKNEISNNGVSYIEKEIKLRLNMDFGDWYVSKTELHEVVFKNKKTKEEIKKYF